MKETNKSGFYIAPTGYAALAILAICAIYTMFTRLPEQKQRQPAIKDIVTVNFVLEQPLRQAKIRVCDWQGQECQEEEIKKGPGETNNFVSIRADRQLLRKGSIYVVFPFGIFKDPTIMVDTPKTNLGATTVVIKKHDQNHPGQPCLWWNEKCLDRID